MVFLPENLSLIEARDLVRSLAVVDAEAEIVRAAIESALPATCSVVEEMHNPSFPRPLKSLGGGPLNADWWRHEIEWGASEIVRRDWRAGRLPPTWHVARNVTIRRSDILRIWGADQAAESQKPETTVANSTVGGEAGESSAAVEEENIGPIKSEVEAKFKARMANFRRSEGRAPKYPEDIEWGKKYGLGRDRIRELRREYRTTKEKKGGPQNKIALRRPSSTAS